MRGKKRPSGAAKLGRAKLGRHRIVVPHGRPDVMLVEIKTLYGPVRLSMPRSIALKVGRSIAEEAEKLAPDRSLL